MGFHSLVNLGGGLAGRRSAGHGEGVLWLHPYALDSSCWTELWDQLPRWRHVGVDLPGHGCSEPLGPREDLRGLAERLCDVAVRHQVRHAVGLSLGATLALAMTQARPGALTSLVLASPVPAGMPETEAFWRRYRELANMYLMAGFGGHLRGRLMLVEPSVFDASRSRPGAWDRLWSIVGRHPFWDLGHAGYQRVGAPPWPDDDLRELELPVLLIAGRNDAWGSWAAARRWAAALPRSAMVELPGAGHLALLEEPAAAAAAVDAHLTAAAGSGAEAVAGRRIASSDDDRARRGRTKAPGGEESQLHGSAGGPQRPRRSRAAKAR
jgi:pimeloyl-ACP methyl ester carboxylesterase